MLPPHGSHSTSHHMHARPPDHQCTQPRSAQAEYPQLPRLHKWNSNSWKYWSIQLGFAHHLCIILRLLQSLGPENEWDKVGNGTTMLHKPMSALGLLLFDPILVCPSCETNINHSSILLGLMWIYDSLLPWDGRWQPQCPGCQQSGDVLMPRSSWSPHCSGPSYAPAHECL